MVALREQIIQELDQLTPEQQQRLFDYAKRLRALPEGTPGNVLLEHMEDFDFEPGEVDDMMQAIEESCEQVNLNEWK